MARKNGEEFTDKDLFFQPIRKRRPMLVFIELFCPLIRTLPNDKLCNWDWTFQGQFNFIDKLESKKTHFELEIYNQDFRFFVSFFVAHFLSL
jgi:hypothetical protein